MSFRSKSSNFTAASGMRTITAPAGIVDGDILIAWAISDSSSTTITWPTGFDSANAITVTNTAGEIGRLMIALKIANGESGNYSLTASTAVICGMVVHSGRSASTVPHRQSTGVGTGATRPWTPTTGVFASNTSQECDILLFVLDDITSSSETVSRTPPSGFTIRDQTTGTSFFQGSVASKDLAAAGETGAYAQTDTSSGSATSGWGAIAIALATASATGKGPPRIPNITRIHTRPRYR